MIMNITLTMGMTMNITLIMGMIMNITLITGMKSENGHEFNLSSSVTAPHYWMKAI